MTGSSKATQLIFGAPHVHAPPAYVHMLEKRLFIWKVSLDIQD